MENNEKEELIKKLLKEKEELSKELNDYKTKEKLKKSRNEKIWNFTNRAIVGKELKGSLRKLFNELPNNVKRETLADLTGSLIKRFSRFWIIGLIFSIFLLIVPLFQVYLLIMQNKLFENQNKLSGKQVLQDSVQLELFDYQNKLLGQQNINFGQPT